MRAFTSLFKKEFSDIYANGAAYLIFFVYLLCSTSVAFYFGHYADMHDAAIYSLFYLQPYILAIIVPVLTMRTWSEEYRSHTAEWLLSAPMSDIAIVLAKWFAVIANLTIMLLLLIPFVLITLRWLHLDLGNILTCFSGLFLTMTLFSAIGCFVSALSDSMLKTYLSTIFILFLILLFPYTFFADIYDNFLFADIRVSDIFYFVLFSAGFLLMNIITLSYRRAVIPHRGFKFAIFSLILLIGLTAIISAISYLLPQKIDLTSARLYTPKAATIELVQSVKKPITVDIYVAQDYLRQRIENKQFFEQISRFLYQYTKLSRGMINVRTNITEAFSEAENNALQQGLYFEENKLGGYDYFGAIVHGIDEAQYVIQHFVPQRFSYIEKDVDTAILQISQPAMRKKIGVYLDARQNLDSLTSLMLNLENDYDVKTVTEDSFQISPLLDLLILVNPKELPPLFMYAIDQYVMRGGNILVFIDAFTQSQSSLINSKNIDLITFLNNWGVKFTDTLVDRGNLSKTFKQTDLPLVLDSAAVFNISKEQSLMVEDFISADNGYIGAIFSGALKSAYDKNPFAESNPALKMPPFIAEQKQAKVAIISDVDILDEDNWTDPRSVDRQQHSLIPTAANGEAVRGLIDYMVENFGYLKLPINTKNNNVYSINQQIYSAAQNNYSERLAKNIKIINQLRAELYAKSGNDDNRLQQMLQISTDGQQLAVAEKEAEELNYATQKLYLQYWQYLAVGQIVAVPLLFLLILWQVRAWQRRRKQKQIKEMFND